MKSEEEIRNELKALKHDLKMLNKTDFIDKDIDKEIRTFVEVAIYILEWVLM